MKPCTPASIGFRNMAVAGMTACLVLITPLVPLSGCSAVDLGDLLDNLNSNNLNANSGDSSRPLDENSVGFFINNDTDSDLLIAGRGLGKDEFFVFGTRQGTGYPDQVQSILVRTASGQESFINFDDGWPVYAEGPDGSFARIRYVVRTQAEIVANVTIHDGTTEEEEIVPVSFNGFQTAQQVANRILQLTRRTVEIPRVPTSNTFSPRGELSGLQGDDRASRVLIGSVLFSAFVVTLIPVIEFTVAILGQVLTNIWDAAVSVVQQTIAIIFTPLFLIGGIIDDSLSRIEFTPLLDIIIEIPRRPMSG